MIPKIIIENGIVRIELLPENEFEKRLIEDCHEGMYDNAHSVEAVYKKKDYYNPGEHRLTIILKKDEEKTHDQLNKISNFPS